MKKLIQYVAYLVPIVFAAVCLAVFCRFYSPCPENISETDYVQNGSCIVKTITFVSDSEP